MMKLELGAAWADLCQRTSLWPGMAMDQEMQQCTKAADHKSDPVPVQSLLMQRSSKTGKRMHLHKKPSKI